MANLITKFLELIIIILKLFESNILILYIIYSYFKKLVINKVSRISCNFFNNI
jgi:hypothetical protein